MAYIQKGTSLGAGVSIRSSSDRVVDNETQRSVERTVVASYPGYLSNLPAKGSAIGITGMPLVKFRGCQVQQDPRVADFATYVLTYNQQEPDSGELPPQPVLREHATANLKPWTEHPNYRDIPDGFGSEMWNYYNYDLQAMQDTEDVPAAIRGRRFYFEVDAAVSYTQYFGADPGSIQAALGVIGPPPGESGSGSKWMVVDGARAREGRWWARTLVYGYNAKGWSTLDGAGASA